MASEVVWDARVVTLEQDSMGVLAYIPEWENLQFSDSINEQGYGTITFDFDSPWLADFYTAQSKYPWEGIYGVQFLRDGTLVYTFICEEAEIQYVGPTRRVALGGRGLAGCLEWGIVLPEGFDESLSDPDDPDNVLFMTRGFGSVATNQSDIDAGNYSVDSPQHKAYGGGAFVHLFQECDTGNAQTWSNITTANANRSTAVTWPLSLSTHLDRNTDSNDVAWSNTGTYPAADVTNLFEINAGLNMFDVLLEACSLTANSQWNVKPDGTIHIAKQIGIDRSATILLSIPQAQTSSNSLNSKDSRSFIYASNGYLFEQQSSAASVNRFGRREGFVDADQSEGQLVSDIAKHALEEVKDQLDEFSFAYYETADSEAFIDFAVGDTVNIEYEPGVVNARQVTALSASVSSTGSDFEVTVGDVVENAIAVLNKKDKNNQNSHLITTQVPGWGAAHPGVNLRRPVSPPSITSVTPKRDGVTRSVTIAFKTPGFVGTQSLLASKITGFEAEVYLVSDSTVKHTSYKAIDRTSVDQTIVVTGMGERGSSYRARVRAVSKERPISEFAISDAFNLTDSGEGGVSDPYKPGQVSGVTLFPMLNAILVRFTDFTGSTNPTVSGPRGKYEIQISNASGGANFGSGNTWTRTIGGNTSGESATSARTFVVPDGTGFICTGLLSEVGGRTHYVRVRAVNWDGSTGDYSATASVSLDTSDESQVGVVIGEDSITATNILAGTITATEILAGSITADRMNADQVITSAIRMPQPSGASNAGALADGSVGNEIKFSVDKDGNMWWGNFTTYANAENRIPASGSINNDYVWTRFKGDGSDYRIGTPNNFLRFSSNPGLFSQNLYLQGTANIQGNLVVETGEGGSVRAGNTQLTETRLQFGTGPFLSIDHALGTYFGGNSIAIKWGGTAGSDAYGYIAGGNFGFGSAMIAMGMSTSSYHYSSATQSGIYASGSANIHIHSASRFMKIEASGSTSYIQLTADDGIYINDITPTNTGYRMYNIGGTLHFNGSALGGMDIANLTTATPGNPALTFIPWAYSTAGTEKKMTVATLAQELLDTGEFVDPDGANTLTSHLTMDGATATSATIRGDGSFLFFMRSSSTYAIRIKAGGVDIYEAALSPRYVYGTNLGSSSYPYANLYVATARAASYLSLSDQNLKTDITDETKGVDFLKSLRPITYKWRETPDDKTREIRAGVRKHHGFVAQEVRTALGDDAANDGMWCNDTIPAVPGETTEDGTVVPARDEREEQSIRYQELIGPIVKAIQELAARIEALEG
jgi:hypothetical protein